MTDPNRINFEIAELEGELSDLRLQETVLSRRIGELSTRLRALHRERFQQEQERLASYPIADRDGYEPAELYARDRREAQRIVEPEPPIERGRRDRGAWE